MSNGTFDAFLVFGILVISLTIGAFIDMARSQFKSATKVVWIIFALGTWKVGIGLLVYCVLALIDYIRVARLPDGAPPPYSLLGKLPTSGGWGTHHRHRVVPQPYGQYPQPYGQVPPPPYPPDLATRAVPTDPPNDGTV